MDFLLSKLLPVFIYPLGLALALGVIGLLLHLTRARRAGHVLWVLGALQLWVASTPVFANWFYSRIESAYPAQSVDAYPQADVIVLLGGFIDAALPPRIEFDATADVDRGLEAARLYHAGKAPRIIASGGDQPWSAAQVAEAGLIADLLVELGVPREAIVVETASRNTRENAVNVAAIMAQEGWDSALLVTSAAHMSRAMATFAMVGVDTVAVPADFKVRFPLAESFLDYLPDPDAVDMTSDAIKELLGYLSYWARGWI